MFCLVSARIGYDIVTMFGMKGPQYVAMPRKLRTSVAFCGTGALQMASAFFASTLSPSSFERIAEKINRVFVEQAFLHVQS